MSVYVKPTGEQLQRLFVLRMITLIVGGVAVLLMEGPPVLAGIAFVTAVVYFVRLQGLTQDQENPGAGA